MADPALPVGRAPAGDGDRRWSLDPALRCDESDGDVPRHSGVEASDGNSRARTLPQFSELRTPRATLRLEGLSLSPQCVSSSSPSKSNTEAVVAVVGFPTVVTAADCVLPAPARKVLCLESTVEAERTVLWSDDCIDCTHVSTAESLCTPREGVITDDAVASATVRRSHSRSTAGGCCLPLPTRRADRCPAIPPPLDDVASDRTPETMSRMRSTASDGKMSAVNPLRQCTFGEWRRFAAHQAGSDSSTFTCECSGKWNATSLHV